MFQHILIPLDGSKRAEQAIPVAARLARASGEEQIVACDRTRAAHQRASIRVVPCMQCSCTAPPRHFAGPRDLTRLTTACYDRIEHTLQLPESFSLFR